MLLEFRLALLTLAVGLAYVPGLPSGATAPRWWVLALGLVVVLWKQPRGGNFPGLKPIALLVAWCVLGLLWTATPWDTLEGVFAVVLVSCVFLLATQAKNLDWCWEAAALVCFCQVPVLLLQLASDLKFNAIGVSGLFFSKNLISEFALATGVGVLFTKNRWLVVGPLLCLVLVTVRNPALEVLVGAFAAGITYVWLKRYNRRALLVGFVAALAAFSFIVTQRPGTLVSFGERLDIWQATLLSAWDYPFGWGLNSFADAAPHWEFVHNDFLQLFFELGVPGVIVCGFVFIRSFKAEDCVAEKCALAALVGCSFLWWPLRSPATLTLAALVLGHLYGVSARAREFKRYRRTYRPRSIRYDYEDISPDAVRAARAGCEVLPPRPQYPLVGGELQEHV